MKWQLDHNTTILAGNAFEKHICKTAHMLLTPKCVKIPLNMSYYGTILNSLPLNMYHLKKPAIRHKHLITSRSMSYKVTAHATCLARFSILQSQSHETIKTCRWENIIHITNVCRGMYAILQPIDDQSMLFDECLPRYINGDIFIIEYKYGISRITITRHNLLADAQQEMYIDGLLSAASTSTVHSCK